MQLRRSFWLRLWYQPVRNAVTRVCEYQIVIHATALDFYEAHAAIFIGLIQTNPRGPAQVIHVTSCDNESASEPSGMFVAPVSMHTSPRAPTQPPNPKPFLSIKDEGKEGRVSIQSVSRLRMPHSQVATPRARPRGREVVLCAL